MKTLGQVAEFLSGGTPRKGVTVYWGGDIPWYSASNMTRRFLKDDEPKITSAGLEAGSRLAPPGATLILVRGSGLFNHIPICFADAPVAFNQDVKAICPREGTDPLFLHFWIESLRPILKESIGVTGIGAGKFDLSFLQGLPFPDLPIERQEAIGKLAASFDRKIELNRRMNATLETMARAIFRDWFVDFGPTRAKIEGREPYLAPDLWPLFPARLTDQGIPEGWEMGTLGDVAESPRRGVKPSEIPEHTPYIGLEHMPRRSIALSEWEGAGKVTSNKSAFRKGEFLFGKLRPYFHKVGVAPVDGICSTDIVVVRPKRKEWSAYTLACISSDDFVEFTNAASTGTKMPRTSWKVMSAYETCLGTNEVVAAYQRIVAPMIERIIANIHESRTLAQTRDLLLPRLMSGELRVAEAEAEKIVEGGV